MKKAYKLAFGKAPYVRNRITMRVKINPNDEDIYVAKPSSVNTTMTAMLMVAALKEGKPYSEEDAGKLDKDYGENKEVGIFRRHKRHHNGVKYQLSRSGFRLETQQ